MNNTNKYYKKSIYIKPHQKDVYDHLVKKGRFSSEYICELVRMDMENDIPSMKLLKQQMDELLTLTRLEYRGDGQIVEVPVIEPKKEIKASEIEMEF